VAATSDFLKFGHSSGDVQCPALVGTFRFNGGPPVGLRQQSGRSADQIVSSKPVVRSGS